MIFAFLTQKMVIIELDDFASNSLITNKKTMVGDEGLEPPTFCV